MSDINKGFIQYGGKVEAHTFAAGENAQASSTEVNKSAGAELEKIVQLLAELQQQIERHRSELPIVDEVLGAAEAVKDEVQSAKPNKLTIMSVLDGITRSVQSVSDIATIVEGIKAAVTSLLGN
jgi:hypothetical protein